MKIITSTQYRRPEYTKKMLEHLKGCLGIEEYKIIFSIDRFDRETTNEIISLCGGVDFCEKELIINMVPLGCNKNTLASLTRGFELSDYVIHIEDDILTSYRSLKIFEELKKEKREDVFSVSLYNRLEFFEVPERDYGTVLLKPRFTPWGFALWKESFDKIQDCFYYTSDVTKYLSWDLQINNFCEQNNLKHIFTKLSRVDNIGAENGVHVPNAEWHALNHRVPFWADMLSQDNQPLRLEFSV